MSVLSGTSAILHCVPDPGNTTIMITWKTDLMYDTSCLMSIGDTSSYSNCTERAIHKNLTLEILNTHITDTGNYTCELVTSTGTFFKIVILNVLVSPSVSLGFDSGGFPECRAVGGNPAANISWIPESDNVISRSEMDPNKTWTVISTYRASVISGIEVTCIVSHPTFTQPETRSIADPSPGKPMDLPYSIWAEIPHFYSPLLRFRNPNLGGQVLINKIRIKEDLEPYASYIQKVNVIYSSVPGS
ncbi:cell surface glycoprotein CD200 receptor 1-A-like [Pelodytes ibericus]